MYMCTHDLQSYLLNIIRVTSTDKYICQNYGQQEGMVKGNINLTAVGCLYGMHVSC